MIKALNPLTPEWWTPPSEVGKEAPTAFKIRPLSSVEYFDVETYTDMEGNTRIRAHSVGHLLRCGLLDWRNFGTDAEPLAFTPGNKEESIQRLDFTTVADLVREIHERTLLREAEIKNSSRLRTSQPKPEGPSTAQPADGGATATSPTPHPSQGST
jgi:hypothetical protein